MKKILVLMFLFSFSYMVFAQQPGWRSVKNTNISVSGAEYSEMFSNSFGNNVILQNTNGSITYYVMNPSTGQAGSAITVESSGASLANITGDAYKVYVVYKKDNVIKCKYTTNSGANWSTISDLGINLTSLDAVYDVNGLHITYQIDNLAKYRRFTTSWGFAKDVSEQETGTNPMIKALPGQNKIYVVYNNGDNSKSREYNVSTNSWGGRETLYSSLSSSLVAGFGVDANYIYLYYSRYEYSSIPGWHYKFYTRKIQKSDYTTVSTSWESHNNTWYVPTTTTADSKVHSAYKWFGWLGENIEGYERSGYGGYSLESGLVHEYYNNGTVDFENIDIDSYGDKNYSNIDISSTHNDLYSIWKISSSNYLRFRQYDTNPSTPTGLAMSTHNNHPKLTWNKNPDADVDYYRVYKKKGDANYTLHTTIASTVTEYVDNEETVLTGPAQANETKVKYKISTKDLSGLESGYSNEVEARIPGQPLDKNGNGSFSNKVDNYELQQNYPNPFNPMTSINYQIKEKGLVSLKVFDMLGKEVAELVNETKDEGQYSIMFDASNLPSGVYIYSIRVNDFVQNNKMTLLK